ncbi:TraR/DksA family transcriptional regulator [Desulfobaculum sp. SPO524]|uniref:TraR/DksA family transcriptional regulator n=1 Tax=Desulfobaculum sp. SPO524 TaxID=3378071 RepID=UPI0038549179
MTKEEREQIATCIREEIETLRETVARLEDSAKTVDLDQPIGRLSRMDSLTNQGISGKVLAESKRRLLGLERALANVDDEDFGHCEECGEPIPVRRLLIMPEASLCVDCAE